MHLSPASIETETARIWLTEDGMIYIMKKLIRHETLRNAIDNVEAVYKINGMKRRPMFINAMGVRNQDKEVLTFYSSEGVSKAATAIAILIDSNINKFLANAVLALKAPAVPTKLFTSREDALKWLRKYEIEEMHNHKKM